MLRKKEKKAFCDFNWVEAFSSCTVFSVSKKLKIKQMVYHKKSVSVRQKLIFKRKNPKYFHRTYFNFDGKKLIVKTLFIKLLLA